MNYKNLGYAVITAATAALFVIGSAVPGEAKGKKKEAAAAPVSQAFCFMKHQPVCAAKGDMKFTYSNACFAARDGAKVVSEGPCKDKKAMKGGKKKGKKAAKKPKKM